MLISEAWVGVPGSHRGPKASWSPFAYYWKTKGFVLATPSEPSRSHWRFWGVHDLAAVQEHLCILYLLTDVGMWEHGACRLIVLDRA